VRIEAAIFDMDGLLVDSEPIWHEVEIDVFGRHGVALTVERCLETKGMFLGDAVAHWYARHPWPGASREEVAAEIEDAMVARLAVDVAFKPGAAEALEFCGARGAALALASSSTRRVIEAVVARLELRPRFAVVHSAEDEAVGKPDPAIFLTTARLLGVAPPACVVFEDSAAGVLAAKGAGMACVAVPEADPTAASELPGAGGGGETLTEVLRRADVVLDSLHQLDETVWDRLGPSPGG
jgi:mannitol-1-/sugar-/sorbitol-6-/2-deoxyglucose-6-phosphatase